MNVSRDTTYEGKAGLGSDNVRLCHPHLHAVKFGAVELCDNSRI